MSNHRVLKYEATIYHTSTGHSHTQLYSFTQPQADEVGAILESDGLNIVLAKKLCEKWTKRGMQHDDIRYSYTIPFCEVNHA